MPIRDNRDGATPNHGSKDALIVDVEMPGLGALEGLSRAPGKTASWPIVVSTDPKQGHRSSIVSPAGALKPDPPVSDQQSQGPYLERSSLAAGSGMPARHEDPGPAYDRDAALERMGGDVELLNDALAAFLAEAPEVLHQVCEAIRSGDAKALVLAAHSMKGMAATLEAKALAAEARRLEIAGRGSDLSGAHEALPAFEREVTRLLSALEKVDSP